jgi:hypothetical protein
VVDAAQNLLLSLRLAHRTRLPLVLVLVPTRTVTQLHFQQSHLAAVGAAVWVAVALPVLAVQVAAAALTVLALVAEHHAKVAVVPPREATKQEVAVALVVLGLAVMIETVAMDSTRR